MNMGLEAKRPRSPEWIGLGGFASIGAKPPLRRSFHRKCQETVPRAGTK